ncbi:thiolase family protein [Lentibacillus halophilus]|uniref:Thiolase family protein n=1 Tax=Lentibacillus halophilus TaxID=295065 RepID=A0ABN0Z6S0_9BACI
MTECVFVTAKRTPIGKKGGVLKSLDPENLLSPLIERIMTESGLAAESVADVIAGNVVGPGGNISRVSLLNAGLPVTVPGVTIDRQCGSGLEAIQLAARHIQSGAGEIYLAGGTESTSRAPWKLARPKHMSGTPTLYERAPFTPPSYGDPDMGIAAENVAKKYQITREAQDEYAGKSHRKANSAMKRKRFSDEIVPLEVTGQLVSADECPRDHSKLENILRRMPPLFHKDGSVTAGNACSVNDGAALVLAMSSQKCKELGLVPAVRFVDAVVAGVDPALLGIGPVPAVEKLLERQQLTVEDIDVVEFNEAFSSQVLASLKALKIPEEKVNVNGGAIALGHPYGASGAILMTRLMTEMKYGNYKRGLATLGIGGGMGLAVLVEAI